MNTYYIYADGACSGNPGPGGWAYAIFENDNIEPIKEQSGYNPNTTNNRMELEAFINAIARVVLGNTKDKYYICVDSAYVYNCFEKEWWVQWVNNGWLNAKNKPVLNQDLWKIAIRLHGSALRLGCNFEIVKVEGHKSDKRNNYVDKLAVQESKRRK